MLAFQSTAQRLPAPNCLGSPNSGQSSTLSSSKGVTAELRVSCESSDLADATGSVTGSLMWRGDVAQFTAVGRNAFLSSVFFSSKAAGDRVFRGRLCCRAPWGSREATCIYEFPVLTERTGRGLSYQRNGATSPPDSAEFPTSRFGTARTLVEGARLESRSFDEPLNAFRGASIGTPGYCTPGREATGLSSLHPLGACTTPRDAEAESVLVGLARELWCKAGRKRFSALRVGAFACIDRKHAVETGLAEGRWAMRLGE
ncbi:uncharacterized protein EMH_0096980 [Eimeria mitis]|uniref:Uncharacterized protein n=1 Tax=Eimeria mitis TaxID=44415 RepID=U6KKR1_9EIME|nr:uncharacterized protein EMH_0096980 [Eimeria mitis]CDJ36827.1 hypothetical protein EMH_0096980 [Eimeria mitis]